MEKQEPDKQETYIEDLTVSDSGNVKAGAADQFRPPTDLKGESSAASFSDPEYKYVTVRG